MRGCVVKSVSSDRLTERQPVLVNRLSEQQRHLLLKLAERQTAENVRAVEAEAEAECLSLSGMMKHGVPICRLPKGVSVVLCRALGLCAV